jgi:hypothetical protein
MTVAPVQSRLCIVAMGASTGAGTGWYTRPGAVHVVYKKFQYDYCTVINYLILYS